MKYKDVIITAWLLLATVFLIAVCIQSEQSENDVHELKSAAVESNLAYWGVNPDGELEFKWRNFKVDNATHQE